MDNLFGGHRAKKSRSWSPVRIIVLSFLGIIIAGTALLTMPFSSNSGQFTHVVDALFTATSATCVTGLSVFDTWQYWSVFGQIVILLLIQVGGLGLVTFTTGFTLLFRQKLGIKDMALAKESSGADALDVKHLLKTIFAFTFSVELIGALVLMIRFVPQAGALGIWVSVFTAISAFCNAGFDIFTSLGDGVSTVTFGNDPLVAFTLICLIVVGGLGFIVVSDIFLRKMMPLAKRETTKRLSFHTHVVLVATAFLLVAGATAIMISEYNHALKDYNFFEKMLVSLFQSASSRTAGFAPIDPSSQNSITKIISVLLMFIGGSPSSTAGGIKTTTVVVLFAAVHSVLRGRSEVIFLKRRIDMGTVLQSVTIVVCGMTIALITAIIIMVSVKQVTTLDALYESVSAFSTTGFNAPFTPGLTIVAKIALVVNMFVGRVGPISLGLSLVNRKVRHSESILPDGKIIVG
ncbi:MAG: potassium transporter TrkG [Oscillospiraceae bacterium]|nr:potassium transporter TrkG [Oscillospiraceae bacterium]